MNTLYSKTVLTVFVLISSSILILMIAFGFKREPNSGDRELLRQDSLIYSVSSFRFPEVVTFAGENLPLENFDTHESLEREILTSAYRHSSTILIIKKANRFNPIIEKILAKNGIPDDFKYLVAAESEYNNVISPAGATGFWQIMSQTGKEQGMEINNVVDERYDIEKATQFACDFFKKSYERYGSWTMAAASYNSGRAGIDEQIKIQNQKNYYDLLLNEETARYIFRVVAYKLIIANPQAYGFNIGNEDLYPEMKYYEVKIDTAINDFSAFAGKYNTNYKILKYLNPWLRKPYLTPKLNKEYTIKIPAEGMRNLERTIILTEKTEINE
ncbi:MAG TPA: lytic transglycosylase domain-containing protein [Bacteroidales bacterium]|nr:lytic transglycosylase domain-containing protein [Bacteroidales bacterium]